LTVTSSRLDCGISVVTERMPDVRSVAIGFWVGTGSRDEDQSKAGASHFLEHLLFKGTETRSARDVAEVIDGVGGDINAFTTKEYTAFYVRLLGDSTELGLDVLSDIMWSPAFRAEEVDAERQVILEEILMHADEPADLVHEVFTEGLYPGHPLGREVLGDADTVTTLRRAEIAAFHAHHYRPSNIVLAAAGALDHDAIAAGVERRFAGSPGGGPPERRAPAAPPVPVTVVRRQTEQAHVVIGMGALDRDDEDRYALSVVNHVLGGGMSSRLFQEIREKRGLAYAVYSYRGAYQGAGSLAVYAGTAPARIGEVLDVVAAELDRLRSDGVSDRELGLAKSHLRGSLALSLEDSGARMSRIGRSLLVHGRVPSEAEIDGRLAAVSRADVDRVVERVLGAPRAMAVVGPFGPDDFDHVRGSLV